MKKKAEQKFSFSSASVQLQLLFYGFFNRNNKTSERARGPRGNASITYKNYLVSLYSLGYNGSISKPPIVSI
jgi:hypothetical protein